MYIILKSRGMRTVTNYFLFNLSAGDLLTIFQILPNVHFALTQNWIFGLTLCKLSQFFTAFNIAISVFTFIGITTDRYAAIMYPLRPRSSPKATIFFILLIWISAFIVEVELQVTLKLHCSFNLSPELLELYDYALFILMYLLPLSTLAATYVPISIRLWRHREIGEITRAQAESIRSKRRVSKWPFTSNLFSVLFKKSTSTRSITNSQRY
ncbi:hypothetical protein EG68_02457 [Paragonimus skrjabini miyazakii]|uniref:G-protein coupled receptors family 1 profile domain-containing protein n=1 Tax=Paragonimus skrjabini miyazakii TaxID=59628 RepID=A0A8S9YZ52_9TREM|nr:hypothetical protein EG68_02457 [Paragonimus skrjabini miyazakii]